MPTYDYQCEACGHTFELFQRMTDRPKRTCLKCKGKVRRVLGTGAGILFKGSGFYITDYRSEGYKKAAKAEKAPVPAPAADKPSAKPAAAGASPPKAASPAKPSS